jgi:hypothetical protein
MKKLKKIDYGCKKKRKKELPANGRPAVDGLVGEGPAVVLRWWGKRLVEVGWGSLDVREVRGGNGVSGRLCGRWRNEEEMGEL